MMTEQLAYYFSLTFLGNTLLGYTQALGLFVLLYFILMVVQRSIISHLKKAASKTETDVDDFLINTFASIKPHFYSYLSFYFALQTIDIVMWADKWINAIVLIVVVHQVIYTAQHVMRYAIEKKFSQDSADDTKYAAQFISTIAKWILWFVGALLVLQNLGVNVTSLVAGLGIGGIAIAFALQNVLGDLFASLSIYLDKPFVVGDIIKVDDHVGEVEHIGIKTTRIKSLVGEEIVISNSDLLSSRIQNFKKLEKRRVVLPLGVLYETPQKTLEEIPVIVEKALADVDVEFGRAHFKKFGPSSLDFEIVYFVETGDYGVYVELENAVNLALNKAFNENGIGFAYPTVLQYNKSL